MVYLLLFLYLVCLMLEYDVCGKKKHKQEHFIFVIFLMILVSGLRYRLGTDTIIYMDEFKLYPSLSQINIKTFSDFRYQPFWILLNSIGRSFGNFAVVQLITSAIHIGIWGYVLKRICPLLQFSALFFYYIYDFTMFNMEVMRESIAISFFLLSVLALNNGNFGKMIFYIIVATFFHVYALPVFILFYLYYKLLINRPILSSVILLAVGVLSIVNKDFITNFILTKITGNDNLVYSRAALFYANSEIYGNSNLNWRGILFSFLRPIVFIQLLFVTKKTYNTYIHINWSIFATTIWLSALLSLLIYMMPIANRFYNYFHFLKLYTRHYI